MLETLYIASELSVMVFGDPEGKVAGNCINGFNKKLIENKAITQTLKKM
jgi:hypothetical protein